MRRITDTVRGTMRLGSASRRSRRQPGPSNGTLGGEFCGEFDPDVFEQQAR